MNYTQTISLCHFATNPSGISTKRNKKVVLRDAWNDSVSVRWQLIFQYYINLDLHKSACVDCCGAVAVTTAIESPRVLLRSDPWRWKPFTTPLVDLMYICLCSSSTNNSHSSWRVNKTRENTLTHMDYKNIWISC